MLVKFTGRNGKAIYVEASKVEMVDEVGTTDGGRVTVIQIGGNSAVVTESVTDVVSALEGCVN